jgi:hypothetical protein
MQVIIQKYCMRPQMQHLSGCKTSNRRATRSALRRMLFLRMPFPPEL